MNNLKNVKPGDFVKIRVVEVRENAKYPIMLEDGGEYTFDGKYDECRLEQTIFPLENQERWVMVSDDNKSWRKRKLLKEENGVFITWSYVTEEEIRQQIKTSSWNYMKEIEPIIELTLEQIAEKFGLGTEKIKIKNY
jgi:hypothetical protein